MCGGDTIPTTPVHNIETIKYGKEKRSKNKQNR